MFTTKHRSDMWLPFTTDFNNRRVCMVVWFNNSRGLTHLFCLVLSVVNIFLFFLGTLFLMINFANFPVFSHRFPIILVLKTERFHLVGGVPSPLENDGVRQLG